MLEKENRTLGWPARLVISSILLLSPLIVVFLLGAGLVVAAFWFVVLMLMMCVAMLWTLLARRRERAQELELAEEPTRVLEEGEQPEAVRQVMDVELAIEQGEVQVFHGTLRTPAAAVYQRLKRAFFFERTVPMVQEDQQHDAAIVLVHSASPQAALERPVRPLVHWCLFALTVLTTIWAGAAQQGVNLLREPERFAAGLPYAIGLLGILGVHELGHYFAARWHGMRVTPPFFIPVPFGLGTFGAFIQMRSPAEDRRALFDVAVAGPLAGLAIAVPALWLGLQTSTVVEGDPTLSLIHI